MASNNKRPANDAAAARGRGGHERREEDESTEPPPRSPFADDVSDIAMPVRNEGGRDEEDEGAARGQQGDGRRVAAEPRLPSPFADDASAVYAGRQLPDDEEEEEEEEEDGGDDDAMSLQLPPLDQSTNNTLQLPYDNDRAEGEGHRGSAVSSAVTEWSEVVVPFFREPHYEDEKALPPGEYIERLTSGRLLLIQELSAWREQCGISDDDVRQSAEQLLVASRPASRTSASPAAAAAEVAKEEGLPEHLASELCQQRDTWRRLTFEQLVALISAPLTW